MGLFRHLVVFVFPRDQAFAREVGNSDQITLLLSSSFSPSSTRSIPTALNVTVSSILHKVSVESSRVLDNNMCSSASILDG